MAKIIITLALALFLSGCALMEEKKDPEFIIVECPKPNPIPRPDLDTDEITETMDAGQIIQAHRLTIKKLQKWGLEEEAILDGYRNKK